MAIKDFDLKKSRKKYRKENDVIKSELKITNKNGIYLIPKKYRMRMSPEYWRSKGIAPIKPSITCVVNINYSEVAFVIFESFYAISLGYDLKPKPFSKILITYREEQCS